MQADPHGYGSLVASDVLCDDAGFLGVGDRRQVGSVSIGLTLKLRSEEPPLTRLEMGKRRPRLGTLVHPGAARTPEAPPPPGAVI